MAVSSPLQGASLGQWRVTLGESLTSIEAARIAPTAVAIASRAPGEASSRPLAQGSSSASSATPLLLLLLLLLLLVRKLLLLVVVAAATAAAPLAAAARTCSKSVYLQHQMLKSTHFAQLS
jgi:hypothetical protein